MTTYFATASHFVSCDEPPRVADGVLLHAKTMGTARTACGLDASTWLKHWEWRFPAFAPASCPACRVIVARISSPGER